MGLRMGKERLWKGRKFPWKRPDSILIIYTKSLFTFLVERDFFCPMSGVNFRHSQELWDSVNRNPWLFTECAWPLQRHGSNSLPVGRRPKPPGKSWHG